MIDKQILSNWLHDQIEMEMSCIEDLEITEGEENTWGRGMVKAWEMLLEELDKMEERTMGGVGICL